MTVTDTLQLRHQTARRYELRVEGVQCRFRTRASAGELDSSTYRYCLLPPQEFSTQFDLADMKPGLSAITFELTEGEDKWFTTELAPCRWSSLQHWRVDSATLPNARIAADATTIPIKSVSGIFNLSGDPVELSIGQERFSATGSAAAGSGYNLTGVTKGLYPPLPTTTAWGRAYSRPMESDGGSLPYVAQAPFSWHGKLVCLYLDTADPGTGAFTGAPVLLWAGRISDKIVWDPQRNVWQISCTSIISDLDRKLFGGLASARLAKGINLQGGYGRTFWLSVYYAYDGAYDQIGFSVTVPAGFYADHNALASAVGSAMDAAFKAYSLSRGGVSTTQYGTAALYYEDGRWGIYFGNGQDGIDVGFSRGIVLRVSNSKDPCHALAALGFEPLKDYSLDVPATFNHGQSTVYADGPPYECYHPVKQYHNGAKLHVQFPESLLGADRAAIGGLGYHSLYVDDAQIGGKESRYFVNYTAVAAEDTFTDVLTLAKDVQPSVIMDPGAGFVGSKLGEEPKDARQCYIAPGYGPYLDLLFPLLSTGTPNYNSPLFDRLDLSMACAIPSELVDLESFSQANQSVAGSPLAVRSFYPIVESTSWMELCQREAKLFGWAVVWKRGKLRLVNMLSPDHLTTPVTLHEGTRGNPHERPAVEMGTSSVVNQYEVKIAYDAGLDKWGPPIVITDVDSSTGLCVTKRVKIEHPGVFNAASLSALAEVVKTTLSGRWLRFPLPVVTVSLGPQFTYDVWAGDLVRFSDKHVPDPEGVLSSATLADALVLSTSWDHRKKKTGSATLLLLGTSQVFVGSFWAPAIVTTGYTDATKTIAYSPTSYTGGYSAGIPTTTMFQGGDWVEVIETAPTDPENPLCWTNIKVSSQAAGGLVLVNSLNGYDDTKEYKVVFGTYAMANVATNTMLNRGVWQSNAKSELLGLANVRVHRWK